MTEAERDIVGAFQEWQAIEDEKAELSERSKELFAALKAKGYDTKATRAVFRDKRKELLSDPAEVQETEAIYDLYWTALNKGLSEPRARPASARVENIEEFPPRDGVYTHEVCFDAVTGEITEHPDPRSSEVDGGQPSPSPEAMTAQKAAVGSPAAGQEPFGADITVHSGQESASAAQGGNEPASASGASATHSDDFHPERITFLSKPAVIRPLCLHPGEECSGYGSKHCHACLKARDEELVSA